MIFLEELSKLYVRLRLYGKETFGSDKIISQAIYFLSNLNLNEQYNYITLYFEEAKVRRVLIIQRVACDDVLR